MYLKHCEVESQVEYFKCDIQETIKSHSTIKKWAYILHDKDDTAPHYHIYLNFGKSGVDSKQVAEWFGLAENFVKRIQGRATDMLMYLTHSNDSQKNKHQYSPSEVVANFDFETEIKNSKILGDFKNFSYAQQLEYVHSLSVSEQVSAFSQLEKLWRLQCKWLSLQTDRKIDVIFICGKGGTGKTYYAKKLFTSLNYDFCISSSSNDPFQDYQGQRGMLLDDMRDRVFAFEDLLKILDNNTMSSVQSRFSNKVFNGDLIIITSSVPLRYWYRGIVYKNGNSMRVADDDLLQLYRRVGCYVVMTETEIHVYTEIGTDGHPRGVATVYKNELAGQACRVEQKTDFGAMFGKICSPSSESPFDIQQLTIKDLPPTGV